MGIKSPNKTFTFDGKSSADYGVYITGEGVFNAPERAVEMIEIPNRNGAYAMDQGRFNNIQVTYQVGMFDVDESDFADKVSDFRNWLCSKKGYVRLTDDYNPDEYRMAVFSAGVELDHEDLISGECDITFECKPQRFLTSGETEQTVTNNGTLTNPTLFDSSPLLAVKGYGNLSFNGYALNIENAVVGDIEIAEQATDIVTLDTSMCNVGDEMYSITTVGSTVYLGRWNYKITPKGDADIAGNVSGSGYISSSGTRYIGTSWTKTATKTGSLSIQKNGNYYTPTYTLDMVMQYDGNKTITFTPTFTPSGSGTQYVNVNTTLTIYGVWCDSTKSTLGNPTYIVCDIGECYMIQGVEIITLNNVVALGSDLPKLASGTNTFTLDNTITELKVTPNYWKV